MPSPASNTIPPRTDVEFAMGLYRDHLDEASFLYEQRLLLLNDPELGWIDLVSFEDRFESHLDALVIGRDLAIEVCKEGAGEGPGNMHVAASLYCRLNRLDLLSELYDSIDPVETQMVRAAGEALQRELPGDWIPRLLVRLGQGSEREDRAIVRSLGYSRKDVGVKLAPLLPTTTVPDTLCWTLGRLRYREAAGIVESLARDHDDSSIRAQGLLALLRIGTREGLHLCRSLARGLPEAKLFMGICGARQDALDLARGMHGPEINSNEILALGFLGDVSAVRTLYGLLDGDQAPHAAVGLYLITGADLFEDIFIPDAVDPDELFDDEKNDEGGPSQGRSTGITLRKLCDRKEEWNRWWKANGERFIAGTRYRLGRPCSPATVLETLASTEVPGPVRQLAYEEMVVRYRLDAHFEIDMTARRQMEAVTRYRSWIAGNPDRYSDGAWYYAGQIV